MLWLSSHFRAHFEAAIAYAQRITQLGITLGKPTLKNCGHVWSSFSLHAIGRHRESDRESQRALQLTRETLANASDVTGVDPGCAAMASSAVTRWMLGFPDEALRTIHAACACAERHGNPYSLCSTYSGGLCHVLVFRRDWSAVMDAADAAIALSRKYAHRDGLAWAMTSRATALCMMGRAQEGLPALRELLASQPVAGSFSNLPMGYAYEAECCIALGQLREARTAVQLAAGIARDHGVLVWEPEVLRMEGELLLAEHSGASIQAEDCLRNAVDLAHQREARSLELRATVSLAGLWRRQGRALAALDLIAPIYESFSEGFGTADLRAAAELIGQLKQAALSA